MKLTALLLVLGVSLSALASEDENIGTGTVHISAFGEPKHKETQCGCWYYYPSNKKLAGHLIAIGDAGNDMITLMIDGKPVVVGNWEAEYTEMRHRISYSSDQYTVRIESAVKSESTYSSEYDSVLTVSSGTEQITVEAFGSCGC